MNKLTPQMLKDYIFAVHPDISVDQFNLTRAEEEELSIKKIKKWRIETNTGRPIPKIQVRKQGKFILLSRKEIEDMQSKGFRRRRILGGGGNYSTVSETSLRLSRESCKELVSFLRNLESENIKLIKFLEENRFTLRLDMLRTLKFVIGKIENTLVMKEIEYRRINRRFTFTIDSPFLNREITSILHQVYSFTDKTAPNKLRMHRFWTIIHNRRNKPTPKKGSYIRLQRPTDHPFIFTR